MPRRALLCVALVLLAAPFTWARTPPIGIHFDIEPQSTAQWQQDEQAVFAQLLVLLQSMQQRWHANGSPGTYVWDIPDWYQTYTYSINGTTANFMQWVLQNVDIPNVLDFQSDGADMISRAQPTMAYAKQLGIPISAAIETTDVGDDQISFYGQSMQQLQETLIQVNSQWTSEYPTFRGFLLHDLVGLQGMSTNGSSFQSQMLPVNVYVWQYWLAWANYTTEREQMWAFLKQIPFQVTSISFESELMIQIDQFTLQSFIEEAATNGFQVELAYGNANWTFTALQYYPNLLMQFTANFIKYGPLSNPYDVPTSTPGDGSGAGSGSDGSETGIPSAPTDAPYIPPTMPWPSSTGYSIYGMGSQGNSKGDGNEYGGSGSADTNASTAGTLAPTLFMLAALVAVAMLFSLY